MKFKYLSTGEFAKLCNVKKHTLFHYDEIGILPPASYDNNGYRLYSFEQLNLFYFISVMKQMNMSLSEIKSFLNNRNPKEVRNLFINRVEDLNEEINKLKELQSILKTRVSKIDLASNVDISSLTIEEQEEEHFFLSKSLKHNLDKNMFDMVKDNFNEYIHKYSIDDSTSTLISIEKENNKYIYTPENFLVKLHEYTDYSRVFIKKKGIYLIGYHKGEQEKFDDTYDNMINFIKNTHYEIGKYSYAIPLLDALTCNNISDILFKIIIELK